VNQAVRHITWHESESNEDKEIPQQHTVYIEQFPKISVSETRSKISLQTQIPTLRFSLIDERGWKMSKYVPVQ